MDAFAAGAGTETFEGEDVFLIAPLVGVGEHGGILGFGVDMGGFHEDWGLGVLDVFGVNVSFGVGVVRKFIRSLPLLRQVSQLRM